jgi:hypothetical protein
MEKEERGGVFFWKNLRILSSRSLFILFFLSDYVTPTILPLSFCFFPSASLLLLLLLPTTVTTTFTTNPPSTEMIVFFTLFVREGRTND